jgi:hypothetical protein
VLYAQEMMLANLVEPHSKVVLWGSHTVVEINYYLLDKIDDGLAVDVHK